MRLPCTLMLAASLVSMSGVAAAQIFECIDGGGKLEFAQKCAPGTVRQREVSKAGAASLESGSPPQTSYQEQEHAFRQRQFAREAAEAKSRDAAESAEKKCVAARSHLVSIENARRVSGGNDPQTGQPRYLDDNERAAATQKAREAVAAYCK